MAVLQIISRLGSGTRAVFQRRNAVLLVKSAKKASQSQYCTVHPLQPSKVKTFGKLTLIGASIGVLVGVGYSYKLINEKRRIAELDGTQKEIATLKHKPHFVPSRKIVSPADTSGLKLTLFQYQSCPFCCKVRVFLDYYGLSYDVVEVNPVMRKEISWSSYKKVPIVLTSVSGGYQPLNDSSMIISLLASLLREKSWKVEELINYYPTIAVNDNGKLKEEIINKYFLMHGNNLPSDRSLDDIKEERKWRQWVDEVFVHVLSPNVYQSLGESYETFNWFSKAALWEEYFPTWERLMVINVGACAMWLVSKGLKKKYNLKDDVRQSFYDEVNYWLNGIKARGTQFMGGHNPDLSDLAFYGTLKSIEGCRAFKDVLENTKLSNWYNAMTEKVESHAGATV